MRNSHSLSPNCKRIGSVVKFNQPSNVCPILLLARKLDSVFHSRSSVRGLVDGNCWFLFTCEKQLYNVPMVHNGKWSVGSALWIISCSLICLYWPGVHILLYRLPVCVVEKFDRYLLLYEILETPSSIPWLNFRCVLALSVYLNMYGCGFIHRRPIFI